jgi:ribonuclease T1
VNTPGVRRAVGILVAAVLVLLGWWLYDPNTGGHTDGRLTNQTNPPTTVTVTATPPSTGVPTGATDDESGLPLVPLSELPPEVADTITEIDQGEPYPYDRDGVTFENREGLLPGHETGYYHEFTVETPGSDDRGARRVIAGDGGEQYYTGDHYESFVRIAP